MVWYTHADRSISRANWLEFQNSIVDRGPLTDIEEYWDVDHLSVDPSYQRRGIGSALIQYVQQVAAKDNLPIVLAASVKGRPMYKKHGFVEKGECELGAGHMAETMVWYPNNLAEREPAASEPPSQP